MIIAALFLLFQLLYLALVINVFRFKHYSTCLTFLSADMSSILYFSNVHCLPAFLAFPYHFAHRATATVNRFFMVIVTGLIFKQPVTFVTHYTIAFKNASESPTRATHGWAYVISSFIVTLMTSVAKITSV